MVALLFVHQCCSSEVSHVHVLSLNRLTVECNDNPVIASTNQLLARLRSLKEGLID